ncbi:MAG: hypothetical protein JWQ78_567, partial [Sediminibacterium sp.]|nr:hypothetical protein [Sediminibacterium sp.]
MKYILALAFLVISSSRLAAQQETPKQLQEAAKALLQQGQYDKAVLSLDRAHQLEPGNNEIMRDLAFANYLKRDFAKAIELGKELVEKPGADQQDFQILGLSYKAIASYKECGKLYKTALKKFPNSGVIYNEYGELLALDNNIDATIEQWEKGIELDPGYSSNYYNAALYYTRSKNWLRAALYSELFLNLESFSARTDEIKKQLPEIYQGLFTPGALQTVRTTSEFEKAVISSLVKATAGVQDISPDHVARIRTRFIQDWVQDKQK